MSRPGPLRITDAATLSRPLPRATAQMQPSSAQQVRGVVTALILAVCLTLVLFLSHLAIYPSLRTGDVSASTMLAPRDFSFQDDAATQARRSRVRALVPEQFRTDPEAQQRALGLATAVFRAAMALPMGGTPPGSAQIAALLRASGGTLPSPLAASLLVLTRADLDTTRALVLQALGTARHQNIYTSQVAFLQGVPPFPATLPSGTIRTLAAQLYGTYLRANHVPDDALTGRARELAAAQVSAVRVSYRRGQAIIHAGDVVDDTTLAALRAAGTNGSNGSWQLLIADLLICMVVAGFLHGYLIGVQSPILTRPRQLLLLDALFLGTLLAAAFVLQNRDLLPFIFPVATLSMSLTVLLNCELSMVATALWAILAGWYLGGSFEMATYYLVTGLVGALLVRKVRRSGQFFVAGSVVAAIGLATILAFRLLNQGYDWIGFGTYAICAAVSGGLAAALTLGSLSLLGRLFGVTTALHLLELSHPNHPLLRRLMVEAPGTYHHSIMVGTLSERAAEQIGADPLLVRVCAYFHDIGKLIDPASFAENQAGIRNIHEDLEAQESARRILQHVFEGVRLARQHHLPEVLEDGIWQHHGTNMVSFFYQQAVEQHGEDAVRIEDFHYPGPRPRSREMAVLMLADGVEAAVRASPGVDADQIRAIIHRLGQGRLQDGQFDESGLTLRDLAVIEDSFAIVLQGLSHRRVQYPAPLPVAAASNQ